MLVLSRRINQEIIISVGGETIIVSLAEICTNQRARIGITASHAVKVHRKEIYDDIKRNGVRSIPRDPFLPPPIDVIAAGNGPEVSGRTE